MVSISNLSQLLQSCGKHTHIGGWTLLAGLIFLVQWPSEDSSTSSLNIPSPVPQVSKVSIGFVSCPLASGQNSQLNEEASVMMKSIVMSARMYGVSTVDFHIFLEDISTRDYFIDQLATLGVSNSVTVNLLFHSAFETVPKQYHEGMVFHPTHRCGFVRFFFPSALPNVDSILYVDTDIIVTGNIAKLWENLGRMKDGELIGVARNNEPEDTNYGWLDKQGFGDIPHVAPKGLNSGMLLMNLTRMREHGWESKMGRLFKDYGKITMLNDQRLLNIMLYYDPGLLHLLPCQYDLMHTHCDLGWICPAAENDPYGIHVIHGACDMFDEGKSFYPIYKSYLEANMTGDSSQDLNTFKELTWQIRNSYEKNSPKSQCFGTLNKLLFKNIK